MRHLLSALLLPIVITALGCDDGDLPEGAGGQGGAGQGGQGGEISSGGSLALDTSYGDQGIARVSRPYSSDWMFAAAWMPDGGLLCGGSTGGPYDFHPDLLLTRFTAAGQLDTSYGNKGFVALPLGDGAAVHSIEPLADGSALISGAFYRYAYAYGFVARVDAKGALDPAFGTGGMTLVEIDFSERFARIARTDAGQIVLIATSDEGNTVWLWRLGADGKLDATFGEAGHVQLGGDIARDVVAQPDGSLLALVMGSSEGELYRVNANGSIDSSFGVNGKVAVPFEPFDLERHSSGKLLIAGGDSYGMLLQLDATGAPDPAFGVDGVLNPMIDDSLTAAKWLANGDILTIRSIVPTFPSALFRGVQRFAPDGTPIAWNDMFGSPVQKALSGANTAGILEKNGTIYIAGSRKGGSLGESFEGMALAVKDDGTLDASFGTAGVAQAGSLAPPEVLWDMALRSDGSIIAMGAAGTDAVLTRFTGGALDGAFGDGGFGKSIFAGNAVTVDASDRIAMASIAYRVDRYTPTGQLDMAFGMQGTSTIKQGNGLVSDIALDAKQRITVSGEAVNEGALLARLLDDGSLDPSFGTGGLVIGAGGAVGLAAATALVIEPDGKIVIAGLMEVQDTFVARVLEDGSTDTSFGAGGKTLIPERIRAFRLIARKGGGYLVAGSDWKCSGDPACATIIVGLLADGTLDQGFGTGGLARIEEASYFQAWAGLAELPDGSIAVTGAIQEDYTEKLAVWRLKADGSLDPGAGAFVLPGKGRATSAIVDGDGLLVGGWAHSPTTGSDMVTLRFAF